MTTPIQLIPAGYLGFLQSKTMGRNPGEASDVVQPTMELTKLYRAPFRRVSKQSANIAATGLGLGAFTQSVPFNQWWAVEYVHLYLTTAAGQAIRCAPAIFQNGTSEALFVGSVRSAGASDQILVPAYFEDPWIAAPGDAFGVLCELLTAGPISAELKIVYTPLPA